MAIAPVSSATAGSAGSAISTLDCPRPSGAGDDHVAVAIVSSNSASPEIVTATDWLPITSVFYGTTGFLGAFCKVLGASEPANYTFNFSTARAGIAIGITAFSGVDLLDPVAEFDESTAAGSQNQNVAPTLTPSDADRYLLCGWGGQQSLTVTPPGSMSEQYDASSTVGTFRYVASAVEQLVGSSATGTRTATTSAIMGVNGGAAISLLFNPVDVTPPAAPTGLTAIVIP